MAILDANGNSVVQYTYDAWGKVLSITGTMADSIGTINPLLYRGYIYDHDTGLYYLQSRYYNPTIERFINADAFVSTGQGFVGNNMFVYCLNNPINFVDRYGGAAETLFVWWTGGMGWLCAVDAFLPIGDIVYGAGIFLLYVALVDSADKDTPIINEVPVPTPVPDSNTITQTPKNQKSAWDVISKYRSKQPVNLPSWKKLKIDMNHIKSGHMPGGPRNSKGNKTVFWGLTAEEILKAIQEAYNNSSKIYTQGERILVRGYSDTYDLLIEMWVNILDFIIETAYPIY